MGEPAARPVVSVITMSKGAGIIERRIADLLAATRDRALSIDDITDHAFELAGVAATRAQRLSATRAAHRVLKRTRDLDDRGRRLIKQAHERTEAACGPNSNSDAYQAHLKADCDFVEGRKLIDQADRVGRFSRIVRGDKPGWLKFEDDFWCAEIIKRRLYFHPPDVPIRVWAVSISARGITWAEAEVTKVTERNVMVRYAGEVARLDRESLWCWWAFWRGVRFVSSRTGRIASKLDQLWRDRYAAGGVPPSMQIPLAEAMALLGVPTNYTREDVISRFRQAAKKAHPDLGGTGEMFRKLVEARDRLLAALGTSAPPPKPPSYAPRGVHVVYRKSSGLRLGSGSLRRLR
jgi:hypothetical protein